MKWVVLVVLLACGSPERSAAPAVVGHRAEVDPLAEADRLFQASLVDDDNAPPPNSMARKFQRALASYRAACQQGHARGCWTAMYMTVALESRAFQAELEQLLRLCRRGDRMACRALQLAPNAAGDVLQIGDPGYVGRTCERPSDCADSLAAECDDGFAWSCTSSLDPRHESKARELAREGCRRGLVRECEISREADDFLRRCTISLIHCFVSRREHRELEGFARRQRELAERACKIGGKQYCVALALVYAWGHFEQSVPGRARYLVDRFCTPVQIATPGDPCNELEDQLDALAKLP